MNHIYRIIWSTAHNAWVVCSEMSKTHGKKSSTARKLLAATVLLPASAIAADTALPSGADFTAGQANMAQHGATLNINQHSQHLATDWQSFNIGRDATVNFHQPNRSAVALNRVIGADPSRIMGNLNANGQVFLENGNGIVFGKDARLNVGGLIATTQAVTANGDGSYRLSGNRFASITNHGNLNAADGGTVALIAPNVSNDGRIQANRGNVRLTAANDVTLKLQDGSLSGYRIDRGTLNALIDNGGAVIADGGIVHLTATGTGAIHKAVINHSGQIEANRLSWNDQGEIVLLADKQGGSTNVSGRLSAQGYGRADGGFIEASAATVNIADSADVNTAATNGKAGTFLIDPYDFVIDADANNGNITGAKLGGLLNSGNVTLETAANGGANCSNSSACRANDNNTGTGNLFVNDAVTWTAGHALTLKADNSIYINNEINADHADAKVALMYGQDASKTDADYYLGRDAQDQFAGKITFHQDAGGKQSFSTQKGKYGYPSFEYHQYTVITQLGAQGDENNASASTLQGLAHDSKLGNDYVLGTDINANDTVNWNDDGTGTKLGFKPISAGTATFGGTLDGLGHTIDGLNVHTQQEREKAGLFSRFNGKLLRNIGMTNVNISSKGRDAYAGALAGEQSFGGTIRNSYATGNVSTSDEYAHAGGLVGEQSDGTIRNSYATANVSTSGEQAYAGGLVGAQEDNSTIHDSYANVNAEVSASGYRSAAGGLVGGQRGNSEINNSYASGAVKTSGIENYAGGLVGQQGGGTIRNSYATAEVVSKTDASTNFGFGVGGLVGMQNGNSTIRNSHATGNVSTSGGYAFTGGLVGKQIDNGTISDSYATGAVSASGKNADAGGLVGGQWMNSTISNSYTTSTVTATGRYADAGGLIGYFDDNSGATFSNAYWDQDANSGLTTCGYMVSSGMACDATAGKTETQLKQANTYQGWDASVWTIQDGVYPTLRNAGTQPTASPHPLFTAGAFGSSSGGSGSGGSGSGGSGSGGSGSAGSGSAGSGSTSGTVDSGSTGDTSGTVDTGSTGDTSGTVDTGSTGDTSGTGDTGSTGNTGQSKPKTISGQTCFPATATTPRQCFNITL